MNTSDLLGKQPAKIWLILATVGMLLIVVGTLLPIFGHYFYGATYKYIYTAGAVLLLVSRLFTRYTGKHDRLRRLYRLESWSAIFFCVASFFMFYEPLSARDWLAFTLAGGAVQVYTSIMIPLTIKRAAHEKE
ncbi:MAG: hypothetical protein HDS58_01825 [Barnesiella sp.]|nr:hypothetical protein [Barnesiella sp.]MBD5248809.1 hypothetical protein [Barnesiella sp.]MDE6082024.1 hypothetical protein [Muribaculaceae bacterium]